MVDLAGGPSGGGQQLPAEDETMLAGAETVELEFASHTSKYTEEV